MRIELILQNDNKKYIDINYQYHISSMIYNILSDDLKYSINLHNSTKNKEFSFSNIHSNRFDVRKNNIIFLDDDLKLNISSNNNDFIKRLYDSLLKRDNINISNLMLKFKGVNVEEQINLTTNTTFTLDSPILINHKGPNDRYEQFISPDDDRFESLFFNNLKTKLNKSDIGNCKLNILTKPKSKLIDIKGIKNKGWIFDFNIDTSEEVINAAYYNGVGCKNSQGFGFVKIK